MNGGAPIVETAHELIAPLRDYLGSRVTRPVEIRHLKRLSGGSSHETWSFDLHFSDGIADDPMPLVIRREFSTNVIPADLKFEFALMEALNKRGLPLPKPRWCETGESPIATPFIIMERVVGVDLRKVLAGPNCNFDRRSLGVALTELQARIHAVDWAADLAPLLQEAQSGGAARELAKWARIIENNGPDISPLLKAAVDWLRRHLPVGERRCLLHGDFKANNVLFNQQSNFVIIDWELAHVGDPLEDLGWTLLWTTDCDLVRGLLSVADYISVYERASGGAIDLQRLFFWRMFSLVKLASIFLAGLELCSATPTRPTLLLLGRAIPHLEREIADLLLSTLPGEALQ